MTAPVRRTRRLRQRLTQRQLSLERLEDRRLLATGRAIAFDGETAYLRIDDTAASTALDLNTTGQFLVEAWIKPEAPVSGWPETSGRFFYSPAPGFWKRHRLRIFGVGFSGSVSGFLESNPAPGFFLCFPINF